GVGLLGVLGVDNYLELRDLGDGRGGGFSPLEKATGEKPSLWVYLSRARSITEDPARHYELTNRVHGWNRMACRERNDLLKSVVEKSITTDEQRPGSCLDQAHEGGVDFAVGACLQYLHV